ncbi:P1 family peptidase [uncultured Enterovirga sp.]|uniref:P1 family peptidase n=1 Tax=uncultured Enterovirga sp. TaxID=2026352 RepID=UPI0035CB372B
MNATLNLITDVPGIRVGHADDPVLASGVTVLLFDEPCVAAVTLPGGAPGGRDTALLDPEMTVEAVDAIALSGGSAFGLDAASGVQAWLRECGRGFIIRGMSVPLVPQAICFDLLNGGDKDWGVYPPYRELAYRACDAAEKGFALGTAGAGFGATTVDLKGGIGSASAVTPAGFRVGALAVVNSIGSAIVGGGPHFWAAPWEQDAEFGGLGSKLRLDPDDLRLVWKGGPGLGTTLAVVATDARLTKAQAKRVATMAEAGLARALRLTFAPLDGDTVFAVATGRGQVADTPSALTEIGAVAADCLTRAIARGVFEARPLGTENSHPSWRDMFARTAN